ncbi:EAL domain-containing protein [Bacillus timonensis]|nr:EAL domain-containing protein [Bacillus timonensis]
MLNYIIISVLLFFLFFCAIFFLEKRLYKLNKEGLFKISAAIIAALIVWYIYFSLLYYLQLLKLGDISNPYILAALPLTSLVIYVCIIKVGKIEEDADTSVFLKLAIFLGCSILAVTYIPLTMVIENVKLSLFHFSFTLIQMVSTIFLVMRLIQQLKLDLIVNKKKVSLFFQLYAALIIGVSIIGCCLSFVEMFTLEKNNYLIVSELVSLFLLTVTTIIYGEKQYQHKEQQLNESYDQLSYIAYHDQLTGLPNRVKVNQIIDELIEKEAEFAMLLIDLDDFKFVNDLLDHQVGDKLLVQVTERLKEIRRPNDVIGRTGGDEFVIIHTSTEMEELLESVTTLQQTISQPYQIDEYPVQITTSIGIVNYPYNGQTSNELYKNGDIALYRAKSKGRDTYHFFSNKSDSETIEYIQLKEDFKFAFQNNELEVYYQPQNDVQTGEIIGFESLLRWKHPQKGFISPFTFISIAEETGLIIPIGEWVLRESCHQIVSWNQMFNKSLKISVNLSLKQLIKNDFVESVREIILETGIDPHLLELEITESVAMADVERTKTTFALLHDLGIKLSLDDFGTGYSSLSYIQQFNINRIKIDKSFIQDILVDMEDCNIVTGILAMATHLNLNVTAEGVETEDHLQFIRKHNCHEAQGFYFSRPVPKDEIQEMLIVGSSEQEPLMN